MILLLICLIFFKSRDFYVSHGIPYKRGYLLFGAPGCGKSSLVSALAGKFGLNICLLQIGNRNITDNVLASLFLSAPPRSLILIEDIDTVFLDRTKLNTNQGVSFSGFINALDGVGSAEGKVVFITTNHEAKLDPALLRSGRIDKEYKIDYADKDEILEMYLFYFPDKVKKGEQFRDSVAGNKVSTAEIQNHFIKYIGDPNTATTRRFDLVDNSKALIYDKKVEEQQIQQQQQQSGSSISSYLSLW